MSAPARPVVEHLSPRVRTALAPADRPSGDHGDPHRLRRHAVRRSWPTRTPPARSTACMALAGWPGGSPRWRSSRGRSVSYLSSTSPPTGPTGSDHRVRLVGLYGLEQSWGDGRITVERDAGLWQQVVDDAVVALRRGAPDGVLVEPKGLAVTVHWRGAPEAEEWVTATVTSRGGAHRVSAPIGGGCPSSSDRRSTWTRARWSASWPGRCSAACYFGDDLGDLPAFAALTTLRSEGSQHRGGGGGR